MVINAKEHEAHTVPAWLKKDLNKIGSHAIQQSVIEAERTTSGEIVPLIVKSSTVNPYAPLFLGLAFLCIGLILRYEYFAHQEWSQVSSWVWTAGALLFGLLGFVLGHSPRVQVFLTPYRERRRQVHQRALLAFYQANLNQTTGRTGILLFISWRERQAIVLADEGIAKFCQPTAFEDVVNELIAGAKNKDLSGGIVRAVKMCGAILSKHLPILEGDRNELVDTLRIMD